MSQPGGHVRATPSAWAFVFLVIAAFVVGTFALILHSLVLWIIAAVVLVVGGVTGLRSKVMDQAY